MLSLRWDCIDTCRFMIEVFSEVRETEAVDGIGDFFALIIAVTGCKNVCSSVETKRALIELKRAAGVMVVDQSIVFLS